MQYSILVTGAAGYIGSHTARYLFENGFRVVAIDNETTGNSGAIKQLEQIAKEKGADFSYIKADISDEEAVKKILKDNEIDAVVHFAAYSLVGESVKDPLKYYLNNTGKTAHLLNAMKDADVKKIVFSSTAATYGEPKTMPIKEKSPQKPINPYGSSKLMIENIMDDCAKAYDMKSIRLRYFNVAGASADGRLGEAHDPETHLIPNVLKVAKAIKEGKKDVKPFQLFGTDYDTKDGTNVRDYIHVDDLARAHFLALQKLFNGGKTSFYNLGSGEGYTTREVFDTCREITGINIPVDEVGRRDGDPPKLIASNAKAEKELGFKPEKTLADMIKSAWAWVQNPKF